MNRVWPGVEGRMAVAAVGLSGRLMATDKRGARV